MSAPLSMPILTTGEIIMAKGLQLKQVMLAVGVSLALVSVAHATGNGDSSHDDHDQQSSCKGIPGTCNNQPGKPWWAKFPGNHDKDEHYGENHDAHPQPKPQPHPNPVPPANVEQQQQQTQTNGDVNGTVKGTNEIKDSGNGYGGVANATSNAGDQAVSIDAADRSTSSTKYSSKSSYIVIPPVMPPMPPIVTEQGDVKVEVLACGPLQTVVSEDVNGLFVGFTGNDNVYLGRDETLAPYFEDGKRIRYFEEKQGDGSVRVYGHQPIITTALPAVSGARQFGVGGFGSGGGGQVGAGTSGSMGRLVSKIQLRECELPGYKLVPKDVVQEAPKVQLQTGEIQVPKKVTRSCYRVTDDHPLNKKPAGMAICPSQGGVRSYTSTVPGEKRDIITEVTAGKKKYLVDDATGKFTEQEVK